MGNLKWQGICNLLEQLGFPQRPKKARESRYRDDLKNVTLKSLLDKCDKIEKGKVLKFYSNQQKKFILNEIKSATDIDQKFTDRFNKQFDDNRSRHALITLFNDYIRDKSADTFDSTSYEINYADWLNTFNQYQKLSTNDLILKHDINRNEFKRLYTNHKFAENLSYQCEYYDCLSAADSSDELLTHFSIVHSPSKNNDHLNNLLNGYVNDSLFENVKAQLTDNYEKLRWDVYVIFDLTKVNDFEFDRLNSSDVYFGRTSDFDVRGSEHQFAACLNSALDKLGFKDQRILSMNCPAIMKIETDLRKEHSKLSEYLCIQLPFGNRINQMKGTLPEVDLDDDQLIEYQCLLLNKIKNNLRPSNIFKIDKSKIGEACSQLINLIDKSKHQQAISKLPKHPSTNHYYSFFMKTMFAYLNIGDNDESVTENELMDTTPIVNQSESTLSTKGIAYHYHCPFCKLRFKYPSSCKVHMFGNKDLEIACQELKKYTKESIPQDAEPIKGNGIECEICATSISLNKNTANLIDSLQSSSRLINLNVDKSVEHFRPIASRSKYQRNYSYHCPACSRIFQSRHQCKRHMGLAPERPCSYPLIKQPDGLEPALCVINCSYCSMIANADAEENENVLE